MLKKLKDIVRKSSIHVCIVNCGGCNGCDVELVALLSPRYDLEQYGIYVHNNPREADVLLVTGAVTEQWRVWRCICTGRRKSSCSCFRLYPSGCSYSRLSSKTK